MTLSGIFATYIVLSFVHFLADIMRMESQESFKLQLSFKIVFLKTIDLIKVTAVCLDQLISRTATNRGNFVPTSHASFQVQHFFFWFVVT